MRNFSIIKRNRNAKKKRTILTKFKQYFTKILNEVNWKHFYSLTDTNVAYEYFLHSFNGLHNHAFPIKKESLKLRTVFDP